MRKAKVLLINGQRGEIVPTVKARHQVPRNAYAVKTEDGKELLVAAAAILEVEEA